MAPKKNKPNGYMLFMKEKKTVLEAQGHKFPFGLGDQKLKDLTSPMWMELTSDQQEMYKARAKQSPIVPGREPMKYDSKGVPLALKEKQEHQKKSGEAQMSSSIKDTVQKLHKSGELTSHYFHFGHFNYAVETEEGHWIPCEVAVAKFSLISGICETYHEYIDPGKIPIGYSFEAKDHSSQTHKIDPTTFSQFNGEYPQITNKIKKLLTTLDGSIAPLYVLESEIPRTSFMLNWLIHRSCDTDPSYDDRNNFNIFNINKLFYELRRYADLSNPRLVFPTMIAVDSKLRSTEFDYSPNMACQWHEDSDNSRNCSLTCVRRHAYIISDLCCEAYNLRLLPNRHCPAHVADEKLYDVQPRATLPSERSSYVTPQASMNDSGDSDESSPRPPTIGSRLAARFGASVVQSDPVPGSSAATNTSSMLITPGPSSVSSSPAPMMGRGRGRGLLGVRE